MGIQGHDSQALLRAIFAKLPIGSVISIDWSENLRPLFTELEFFLPWVLRKGHPDWNRESLGGFSSFVGRKTGFRDAEIFGVCFLITDYSLTPFRFRFQFDERPSDYSWVEIHLGEKANEELVRIPWTGRKNVEPLAQSFVARESEIDWYYHITYGERRD